MTEELHSDKMRNKSVGKLIFEMSMPAIISMLVQSLYNVVDSIFVSNITQTIVGVYQGTKLGDDCFTAVSVVYPMTMLVVAIALGIGVGANAYIARKLGEGNKEKANQAAKTAIIMVFVAWIVILAASFFVSRPFSAAFVNSDNATDVNFVVDQATLYLTIYMAASLGSLLEITLNRILQATGNMKVPMISQLVGALTNIALDALFILVFKWGVLGAVVATIIGQWAAAAFVFTVFLVKKQDVSISLKGFKPDKEYVARIFKVGMPAFIMNAMGSFITIILNTILKNGNGMYILSAYFKVQSFVFMPVFGLMQGTMPILSYNYGANLKPRFNKAFKISLLVSLGIMAVGLLLFQTIPQYILSILTQTEDILRDGAYAFRVISIAFIPAAFSILIINMLQAINRPWSSLIMSLSRQLIVLLPSAYILFDLFGQAGIWFCYPIAEIVSVLVFLPIALSAYRKQFRYKQQQYDQGLLKSNSGGNENA